MYEPNNTPEFTQPSTSAAAVYPKTSRLAVAACIMGLLSMFGLGLPALICGIIALIQIGRSDGKLVGKGYAITGIVAPLLIISLMLLAILLPALAKVKVTAQRIVCANNLKEIGNELISYDYNYNGELPPVDSWCDVLVNESGVSPKSFICPSSDAAEGQSSYAINRSAAGQRLSDLPPDMVLLFEVSPGPRRWNPSGGPESINTEHHDGCNILFADGHTEFVLTDRLHTLRWTPD